MLFLSTELFAFEIAELHNEAIIDHNRRVRWLRKCAATTEAQVRATGEEGRWERLRRKWATKHEQTIEEKLDALYDRVDDLLLASDFATIDKELAAADPEIDLTVALGLLTITYAAKEHLPARAMFASAVFARAEKENGTEEALRMTRGLVDDVRPPALATHLPEPSPEITLWAIAGRFPDVPPR